MKKRFYIIIFIVTLEVLGYRAGDDLLSADRVSASKPKLVLVIVADQFRYEYLLK